MICEKHNSIKEGNVIYLDPNYWYLSGGGLVSVLEMVKKEVEAGLELVEPDSLSLSIICLHVHTRHMKFHII